jgi:hypothetical protein
MRIGFLEDIPQFPMEVYKTMKKSGSRIEYSIRLSDELIDLGNAISSLPLKYASLVQAFPSDGQDQQFHADSEEGERAIVYLTNVDTETNGPIEFKEYGKVLGKAGTYAHYSATEIHRGCASDINRYALALAFDSTSKIITTVGNHPCYDIFCPPGYEKVPIYPEEAPYDENTCCQLSLSDPPSENNGWRTIFIIAIVLSSLIAIYYLLKGKQVGTSNSVTFLAPPPK